MTNSTGNKFSKALYIVTLYRKYTRALTLRVRGRTGDLVRVSRKMSSSSSSDGGDSFWTVDVIGRVKSAIKAQRNSQKSVPWYIH